MKRSIQIRVTPNMYFLLEAIRKLMSEGKGFEYSLVDSSEKAFEIFYGFAKYDIPKGIRIIDEFNKVKLKKFNKFGVTRIVT